MNFPRYLYNNKCFVRAEMEAVGWIWACDSSLEPSRHKNDHVINLFWYGHVARPQRAKIRFLLHKAALNGHFEACIANMNCR